jgi:hypothetical protein
MGIASLHPSYALSPVVEATMKRREFTCAASKDYGLSAAV